MLCSLCRYFLHSLGGAYIKIQILFTYIVLDRQERQPHKRFSRDYVRRLPPMVELVH
jgi:hypothetical protein